MDEIGRTEVLTRESAPVEDAAPEVIRMRRPARVLAVIVLVTMVGLFLAGTTVGSDKWWPFGPWSMYASSTKPSASVVVMAIQARIGTDPQWRDADLNLNSVGLTRAEVEGRIPQIIANPAILGTLATTHARLRPHDPPWTGVRVVRNEVLLSGGAPTGQLRSTTVASWGTP